MSTVLTYRQDQEKPDVTLEWRDGSNTLIDFSGGTHTWELTLVNQSTGVTALTKTAGITGAATSPNVTIAWATGQLALTPATYKMHVRARKTSDSTDRYFRAGQEVVVQILAATTAIVPADDSGSDLSQHLTDTDDAHDASAISFTPTGSIAATNVQAAIAEVASESAAGVSTLDDLTDVTITAAASGDILRHNGTAWVDAVGTTHFDAAGSAAAAQAASQPLDADLTALAAAGNSAVLTATTAAFTTADETKLDGIETGATADQTAAEILTAIKTVDGAGSGLDADLLDGQSSAAFEVAGAAAAAQAASQPLDSDLTAIAALSTTAYGRAFLALADQAALVALLPSYQPLDSDLTAIAALTTTSYGRAFLALADQAATMALLSAASATAQGIVELATTAETTTGTDTARAVTPAGVQAVRDLLIPKTLADANSVLYATSDDTPAALAMGASTILARLAAGNIVAATPTELRTLLTLVPGTDVQAYDAELAALAGLTSAADKVPYFTGSGTAAVATQTSFIRTLLDDTDAATARATLHTPGAAVLAPTNAIAETHDRNGTTGAELAAPGTSGRMWLVAIPLLAGDVVTTISFVSGTTALGSGSNQWFSLWSAARSKLAVTNDDTSTAWGATSVKTLTLTTPYTVLTSGLYYLGITVVASTMPTLRGASGSFSTAQIVPILTGSSDTGLTNPASAPTTAAAITVSGLIPYAYVS